jgi:putative ATP-binding cassette transporter
VTNGRLGRGKSARLALVFDEATVSPDEVSEAALYHLLEDKLPASTIVSIG